MIPRGTTFKFEFLGEFGIEIKNILEHESGAHMGLIHEKNQRPKISCYCTFKENGKLLKLFCLILQGLNLQVGSDTPQNKILRGIRPCGTRSWGVSDPAEQ